MPARAACLIAALTAAVAPSLWAQTRFEAAYGLWFPRGDSTARLFSAGIVQPVGGWFGVGLTLVHLADERSTLDRTQTGGELAFRIGAQGTGFYGIGGVGLGFQHQSGNPDASWTLGGGGNLRLLSSLMLGVEARYRVEDTGVAGFWNLGPTDREGFQIQGRLSFGIPRGGGGPTPAAGTGMGTGGAEAPPSSGGADPLPPPSQPYEAARASGASEEAARLTATVVETALAEMGAPYRWGGTDQNGFDCSGLIQYAYGKHGVVLPRTSRDQMRMGAVVDRSVDQLRPGDILGFSADRSGRISHVGLYVGQGQFIHSASSGVKLSSLRASDGDSRWWRDRWVGVRRVVE